MYVVCVADTGEELEECGTIHKADVAAYRWVMRLHRKLVVKHCIALAISRGKVW